MESWNNLGGRSWHQCKGALGCKIAIEARHPNCFVVRDET